MHAEVIAIGDELTSGQRLDTNSQWLSQQLGDIGIRTMFHTTVADDIEANVEAFRTAAQRVDVIVCTGGLGPTADDLTRQAIASAFDLELELDEVALEGIRQMFESRGRTMPERNRVQAMFPAGSAVIANPHGTAPGVDLGLAAPYECRIFSLPGVPAEMKEMWNETVRPQLISQLGDAARVVRHYRLKCFGTGESALEAMLPDIIRRGRNPTVGITVSKATITLRMTGQAESEAAYRDLIQPTVDTIHECLGELVFGEEDEELQHVMARLMVDQGETLAVSEWGSGGLMAQWFTELPDSTTFFRGGTVVGSRAAATRLLGHDAATDPPELAKQLAACVRKQTGADYGIALGEFPDNDGDPNAKVYIGVSTPADTFAAGRRFAGHPDILRERAAKQALDVLRLRLLKEETRDSMG